MKKIIFLLIIVAILMFTGRPAPLSKPAGEHKSEPAEQTEATPAVIAANLEIPWALDFLPGGNILFTERPGRVKLVDKDGKGEPVLIAQIPGVKHIGEGGLLGLAVHPDFVNNSFIYLYYTYAAAGDDTKNRVARYKFADNKLTDEQVIIDAIPGAANHNGGRIKFGPDGLLYITTGDAQNPSQAQDINSPAGKILRVTNDGQSVYSYGHRNPQGLVWDDNGRLWATEHGRSGVQSGLDEINLIEPGKNYGWPTIQGDQTQVGMELPKLNSGNATWAPAGAAFTDNSIFFGGLRGQALYQTIIDGDKISLAEHLKGKFGRIRDVVLGPDGFLYLTTSNRDGRGLPKAGDDKILRLAPKQLL